MTALVGVNGAGKTTLLSVLAGALRPSSGTVTYGSADLYGRKRRDGLRQVTLMPQHLPLPGNLSCREALSVLAWGRGIRAGAIDREVSEVLEKVGLGGRARDRVATLSGGMQRRLALAQALLGSPDVVLLDEPSTGLDPEQRRRMIQLVASLGGKVLMSSHVLEDVVEVADRVVLLHEGAVVFADSLECLVALAPPEAPPARKAEAAFLAVIADQRGTLSS